MAAMSALVSLASWARRNRLSPLSARAKSERVSPSQPSHKALCADDAHFYQLLAALALKDGAFTLCASIVSGV